MASALIDEDITKVPQVTSTGYQAANATAAQSAPTTAASFTPATATTSEVAGNQLVQNQVRGIIDENSPLQQQAATTAKQESARRGLVNSSMAVTAGQDALYRAALPIAQQDAATYQRQALENQGAKNQYGLANLSEGSQTGRFNVAEANRGAQFNVSEANRVGLVNAEAANRAAEFGAGAANTAALQNLKAQTDMKLQQLDAATRTNLVNIEANYKTLMQASQSASDLYQQSVDAIAKLQNNKDLNADARAALVAQQSQLLQNGLALLGGMNNLNLSQLLDFSNVNALSQTTSTAAPSAPSTPSTPNYLDREYTTA